LNFISSFWNFHHGKKPPLNKATSTQKEKMLTYVETKNVLAWLWKLFESDFKVFIHPSSWNRFYNCNFIRVFTLPYRKLRHTVCQLSGVSTCFQVYYPCLRVAHWNTCVNGANLVKYCRKTRKHIKIIVLDSNVLTQPYFWPCYIT